MNERIWELAKKAGINLTPAQFSGVLEDEVDEFSLEDFAELIVRECSKLVKARLNHIPDNQDDWDGHNYGETAAVYGILDTFQEHFGVDCDPENSKFGVEL